MSMILDGTNGLTFNNATTQASAGLTAASPTIASGVLTYPNGATNGGYINGGTAVASTSGTSIDFTGIPSWVKRITVMFNNVSTNGTSIVQVQLGSGSVATSGYKSTSSYSAALPTQYAAATTGFITETTYANAALTRTGSYIFTLIGSNIWVGCGNMGGDQTALVTFACAGGITLAGTLDRVRITTVNGTDTFDAGSINILYE